MRTIVIDQNPDTGTIEADNRCPTGIIGKYGEVPGSVVQINPPIPSLPPHR